MRKTRTDKDASIRQRVVDLTAQGLTQGEIASALGRTTARIGVLVAELGLSPRNINDERRAHVKATLASLSPDVTRREAADMLGMRADTLTAYMWRNKITHKFCDARFKAVRDRGRLKDA